MKTKLLFLIASRLGLTVMAVAQPVITNQPQNQTALAGTTVTFSVGAAGAEPLTYQWRSHSGPNSFTNIPWGTEASLVLTNVQPTQRRFAVVVTDAGGLSAISSPLVTLTVLVPPSITNQPTNQVVDVGGAAMFAVQATGTTPLSYQWRFNGVDIPGKTISSLFLANVQYTNGGSYSVTVTNVAGSFTSHVAILTVAPALHGFSSIAALPSGGISVTLTGAARALFTPFFDIYPLEASVNLSDWTPLATLQRTNTDPGALTYLDADASGLSQRFYRTPTNHLITPFPKPTGPYAVGTQARLLTDPSRSNRYNIPTNSSFMIQFWYPAEARAGINPAPYVDRQVALTPGFAECVSPEVLAEFVSHAQTNLSLATNRSRYPVLVASHGLTGFRADNTDKATEMASHGYVVIEIDHIDSYGTVFPDGRLILGTVVVNLNRGYLTPIFQDRVTDVKFVLDEISRLNSNDPQFAGRLDLDRVGVFGYSSGGGTVSEVARTDARVKAVVALDAYFDPLLDLKRDGLQTPFLSFNCTENWIITLPTAVGWLVDSQGIFAKATKDALWCQIQDTVHRSFRDGLTLLSDNTCQGVPTVTSRRQCDAIRACMVSFFDKYLKGEDDRLLSGDSLTNAYPEVINFMRK